MLSSIQAHTISHMTRLAAGMSENFGRLLRQLLSTWLPRKARFAVSARVSQVSRIAVKSAIKSAALAAPAALSATDQWSRVSGVLTNAITGAREAGQLQLAATRQLDLAQYALYTLRDELAAVMSVPGRREPASVHVLDSSPSRAVAQALAA